MARILLPGAFESRLRSGERLLVVRQPAAPSSFSTNPRRDRRPGSPTAEWQVANA